MEPQARVVFKPCLDKLGRETETYDIFIDGEWFGSQRTLELATERAEQYINGSKGFTEI